MSHVTLRPPLSVIAGCALASAGIASGVTAAACWSLASEALAAPNVDEAAEAAQAAAMRVLELANTEYDDALAQDQSSTPAEAEVRWMVVRDRYRLFLAHPEAVERWPELAAFARKRADDLAEYVENIAQMQVLEAQALALAEAQKAEAQGH